MRAVSDVEIALDMSCKGDKFGRDPHHHLCFTESVTSTFVSKTCCGALLGEETEGGDTRGAARGRWRRNLYRGALQVFREGLRRYPQSARLLYGASLATQVGHVQF